MAKVEILEFIWLQLFPFGFNIINNIDSVEIKCENNVTLLGINIDFMLRFDDHVSQICKKASKQLAVLKRIGRFLTKQGKMTIYNSFIVSNFNYCPLAWHFCSSSSTNKLEKIQERALRFINNDFTSSLQALLTSTNTAPLHVRRMKQMASEVYLRIEMQIFNLHWMMQNIRLFNVCEAGRASLIH